MIPSARSIRAARSLLGWSQRELADRAGLHQNAVYRSEKDDTSTRQSTVSALARAMEQAGVVFLSATNEISEGVALRKDFIGSDSGNNENPN